MVKRLLELKVCTLCKHTVMFIFISLLLLVSQSSGYVNSRQNRNPGDDFFGEDDFFEKGVEDMDKQDKLHDTIDQGVELWEDECFKTGGQRALDNWLKEQENLIYCAMQNFDVVNIENEIEAKKETGDLDLVFKKYCGQPVQNTRPCIEKFLEVSQDCLKSKDRVGLNVTMTMINAAIDFVCYNSGDRMALFMAENGVQCVMDHQEPLMSCINSTLPELFSAMTTNAGTRRRSVDPVIAFNEENCMRGYALRQCVEDELLKCDDPTPSNVINAMLLAMWKSTPCNRIAHSSHLSAASSWHFHSALVSTLPSILIVFLIRLI